MTIPERWGFCFKGNEEAFTRALLVAVEAHKGGPFIYWEIGVGHGDCLRCVHSILSQTALDDWKIIGVDVAVYSGNALQPNYIGEGWFGPCGVNSDQPPRSIAVNLCGSKAFLQQAKDAPDFVFIDACHCQNCAANEFLLVEGRMKLGGVVCFHDTDPWCQGKHSPQPCGGGIAVRAGVEALGLLDDKRPGWRKIDETFGRPPTDHGCLFVQRIAD